MPQAQKIAGATFWIGTKATNGATDTYTQIAKAKQTSQFGGGSYTMADSTAMDDTIRQSTKTVFDPADIDLEMNEITADAGQSALKTAAADVSDDPYNFEIRFSDSTKRRLKAKVTQITYPTGGATALRMIRAKLEPTTDVTFA